MKRLFIILILVCFLAVNSSAMHPAFLNMIGDYSCPEWHTSVIFGWTGDLPQGTNYAFDTSCNPIQGTNNSLEIGAFGEGGSNAAKIDALNENLTWVDSGKQYINGTIAQTIWFHLYVSDDPDAVQILFESRESGNNQLNVFVKPDSKISGSYEGDNDGGAGVTRVGGTGSWIDIAYSYDPPNADQSFWTASTWQEDLDEITTMVADPDDVTIGEMDMGSTSIGAGKYIYLDYFAIVSGYQTGVPW